MSKRKPNNPRARAERTSRALLGMHRVAVVSMDRPGQQEPRQFLMDHSSAQRIRGGKMIAEAICDIAHRWVIYFGAFCIDQFGKRYIKAVEIAPQGIYKSDSLTEVIGEHYEALIDGCNPKHRIGSGWIANPSGVSLTEQQAARIFEAAGAWQEAGA
jgi:hypothetical protein